MLWLNDPYPGAPGLRFTVQQPVRASAEVRMDIACFVGLTERGPVSTPVAVDSWSAFERLFGRRGGYRHLPDAVHAFFANGGKRVVVIRCVGSDIPTARWQLEGLRTAGDGRVYLDARDPGRWGAQLDIVTRLRMRPLTVYRDAASELRCSDPALVDGSVLWFDRAEEFRVVAETDGSGGSLTVASSVPDAWADPVSRAVPRVFELVVDAEIAAPQAAESYPGCGLHIAHPRYLWTVLEQESRLVRPFAIPSSSGAAPNLFPHHIAGPFVGPWDASLVPANLHDGESTTWPTTFVPGTPDVFELMEQYEEGAFGNADDVPRELQPIVTVAFPDLVHARIHGIDRPVELSEEMPPSTRFETCVTEVAELEPGAEALTGSPYVHLERSTSTNDALALAARESQRTRRLAVLDVPPNDDANAIMTLRQRLQQKRAALYAPWLRVEAADASTWRLMPPSGAVCGIIARSWQLRAMAGVPANEEVHGILDLWEPSTLPSAQFLHEVHVNRIRVENGRPLLMGSRTCGSSAVDAHVNVQRVLMFLARQLPVDTRWAVFEPNNRRLWARVKRAIEMRLERLHAHGALAGATAREAFAVKIDASLHPVWELDAGHMHALVAVAPAVPMEFIHVALRLLSDGRVEVFDA